jgi:chromosome segregation ATPase
MLQLETLMLFGLGFAVAALIALFVARLLWLYALRLGRLRSMRQAPTTHADLRTEINRLRAENAMTTVRLERRAEALATRNAELIARTTRDQERLDLLAGDLERYRGRGAERQIEAAARQVEAIEAEARQTIEALEAEIADRERLVEELREAVAARDEEIAALRESADRYATDIAERDRTIAGLEAGSTAETPVPMAVIPPGEPSAPPAERLRMRIDELAELSRQIEEQREALKVEQAALGTAEALTPSEENIAPETTAEVPAAETEREDTAPRASQRRAIKPAPKPQGVAALASRLKSLQRDSSS